MSLLTLPIACDQCALGETVEIEPCRDLEESHVFGEYLEPVIEVERFELSLMAPVGFDFLNARHEQTEGRDQVQNRVRFYVIPQKGREFEVGDLLRFSGCCYKIDEVAPRPVQCCGKIKLHHIEVEAVEVLG